MKAAARPKPPAAFRLSGPLRVAALAALCLSVLSGRAFATIKMADLFADHMVLQRDKPVAIAGSGAPGEAVSISLDGGPAKTTTAGPDGRWKVQWAPLTAGGPHTLEVKGTNTLTFRDVLVGDVWLLSGQSNISNAIADEMYTSQVADDRDPQLRMHLSGIGWLPTQPGNTIYFSALGYFFGKRLRTEAKVPIGLVKRAYPASTIEEWMDPDTIAQNQDVTVDIRGRHYQAIIAPIEGYTVIGCIWNQGENNSGAGTAKYSRYLRGLITNWRKRWQDEFYVLVTQLPIYIDQYHPPQKLPVEPVAAATEIRQAQFEALALPKTALITTWDISDGNIHPHNKPEVAERLVRAAARLTLGSDAESMGPTFDYQVASGAELALHFLHVGGGLVIKGGGPLQGMALAGADNKWVWANGRIVGDTVVLSHPDVPHPTQARYVWADNPSPLGNLVNKEGLATPTFRSDGAYRVFEATTSTTVRDAGLVDARPFEDAARVRPDDAAGRSVDATGGDSHSDALASDRGAYPPPTPLDAGSSPPYPYDADGSSPLIPGVSDADTASTPPSSRGDGCSCRLGAAKEARSPSSTPHLVVPILASAGMLVRVRRRRRRAN